ncbi:hypothetical protein ACKI1J_35395 [Streptomyces scabiei]|uniref:hypothetical protein n=1 Tax=Streptomyces scabiei TaxID=1930 RepID=UPI0038F718BB
MSAPGPGPHGLLSSELPEAFGGAVRTLADCAEPGRTGPRVTAVSLRHWTPGGFAPVPAPAANRFPSPTPTACGRRPARVLRAPGGDGGTRCTANDLPIRTSLGPGAMTAVTRALTGPDPVRWPASCPCSRTAHHVTTYAPCWSAWRVSGALPGALSRTGFGVRGAGH